MPSSTRSGGFRTRRENVVAAHIEPGDDSGTMQDVIAHQPTIAHAVQCLLPLYDQLEPTLELLEQDGWPDLDTPEPLPANVVRFRPRPRHPMDPWIDQP